MPPTAHDFRTALRRRFARVTEEGRTHVDIRSGDLHTEVGDYPNRGNHRMKNCCRVMRNEMAGEDADSMLRRKATERRSSSATRSRGNG